ncbi:MAG: hypothetical protein IJ205_02345 [Bacteroidales bacterium]|nr:hypothetical protein [Bacteroidales bacterium]
MNNKLILSIIAAAAICVAALTSHAYMKTDKNQSPDSNGHVLASLWKSYYAAQKADLPKQMVSSLESIEKEAKARRLHWDFYDAAVKKVDAESSRNWKLRQELRSKLAAEIEEYAEPIVTYSFRRDQEGGSLTDYVITNKARLQAGRNKWFYSRTMGQMNNLLNTFIKDDYEYALWSERFWGGETSKAAAALEDCLGGTYPNAAWLEFCALNEKRWDGREKEIQAFIEKYSGKAMSLFGKSLLFQDRFNKLSVEEAGEEEFKALYADLKAAEKERKSYTAGTDAKIAGTINDFKYQIENLERKEVSVSFDDGKIIVAMRNLDKVEVSIEPDAKGSLPLFRKTVLNPANRFHVLDTVKLDIPGCDDGDYIVKARNGKVEDVAAYSPKRLSIAVREDSEGWKFYVTDYLSGEPCPQVDLKLSLSGETSVEEKGVKIDGFTPLPSSIASALKGDAWYSLEAAFKGPDGFVRKSRPQTIRELSVRGEDSGEGIYCNIFTDKGAYNPGETVKFKAVLYGGNINTSLHTFKAGEKVAARLFGAEGKEAGRLDLQTNEFGSVAGEFLLAEGQRNGRFRLEISAGERHLASRTILVDEFILPTYDLVFEDVDSLYFMGDEIEVKGSLKSYSGHPLDAASLSYEVDSRGRRIRSGDLQVNGEGNFSIRFKTVEDAWWYNVTVKVKDATGETKEFSRSVYVLDHFNIALSVGNASVGEVRLSGDSYGSGARLLSEESAKVSFEVNNSEGKRVPLVVNYQLKDADGKTVASGSASSGETREIAIPRPGLYTLHADATAKSSEGKEISSKQEMKILKVGQSDKVLKAKVENFFQLTGSCADGSLKAGEQIMLRMGAGDGPVWAVVELFGDRRQLLEQRLVHLDGKAGAEGSITDLAFEYKNDYPDALFLSVFYFRNGKSYTFSREFRREKEELSLPLEFSSFEDNALPGKEYSFTIKSRPGTEAVVAVFDKSSETIFPNRWNVVRLIDSGAMGVYYQSQAGGVFGDMMVRGFGSSRKGIMFKTRSAGAVEEAYAMNSMVAMAAPEAAVMDMADDAGMVQEVAAEEDLEAAGEVAVRSDFATSLAFEPFLRTREDGTAELKFKTSDKLSTFIVQVYAHTPDMLNSTIREEMTVSVPVKVSVAEPQYLYKGDKFVLHATVSSASDVPVTGTVVLQAYPSSEHQDVKPFASYSKKVTVPAGASVPVEFEVSPKDVDELGLKLVFADKAKTFSDGVFVSLPVMKAEQTLTESHSAVLLAGMDKDVLLRRLQSEFTGTTSKGAEYKEIDIRQMLLDAIPSKIEPSGKDVLSLTEAYYVRKVAAKLGADVVTVMPDEELVRNILACRNADGGFAWFQGMKSSPVITAVLLERFAKLRDASLGGREFDTAPSVAYLDRNQFIHGESWPYWCGWLSTAQYAYVRSMYSSVPFDVSKETKSEQSEYSKNFKEFKKYIKDYLVPSSKDGRGLNGQILSKARRIKTLVNMINNDGGLSLASAWGLKINADSKMRSSLAADIASLYEYAVEHRDGGWYYPNAVMPWRGLLESELYAHSLLCDLLSSSLPVPEPAEGRRIADGIRIWIMLQKETQQWADDPAYVDAINSVLSGGEEVLSTRVVLLTKTYSSPFSKIVSAGNGFTIERHFYKEVLGEDSRIGRVEIYPGMQLKVGDKVICEYKVWNQENRSFVKLTAPREAAFRPVNQLSGHVGWWARPVGGTYSVTPQGYRNVKSDRTEYFFDVYPEENTTVTEEFFITQEGTFVAPVVTIESLYAPHYRANDKFGGLVDVRE